MRYRLPAGCGAVIHAGKTLAVAADRSIELDATAVVLLAPHGMVPVDDPVPIDRATIDGLSSVDLVAALDARGVPHSTSASGATLRALLRQALAKPRT